MSGILVSDAGFILSILVVGGLCVLAMRRRSLPWHVSVVAGALATACIFVASILIVPGEGNGFTCVVLASGFAALIWPRRGRGSRCSEVLRALLVSLLVLGLLAGWGRLLVYLDGDKQVCFASHAGGVVARTLFARNWVTQTIAYSSHLVSAERDLVIPIGGRGERVLSLSPTGAFVATASSEQTFGFLAEAERLRVRTAGGTLLYEEPAGRYWAAIGTALWSRSGRRLVYSHRPHEHGPFIVYDVQDSSEGFVSFQWPEACESMEPIAWTRSHDGVYALGHAPGRASVLFEFALTGECRQKDNPFVNGEKVVCHGKASEGGLLFSARAIRTGTRCFLWRSGSVEALIAFTADARVRCVSDKGSFVVVDVLAPEVTPAAQTCVRYVVSVPEAEQDRQQLHSLMAAQRVTTLEWSDTDLPWYECVEWDARRQGFVWLERLFDRELRFVQPS